MNYQQAIDAVMAGKRVRRAAWADPGEHLIHVSRIHMDALVTEAGEPTLLAAYPGRMWRVGEEPPPVPPILPEILRLIMTPSPTVDWDEIRSVRWRPTEEDLTAEDWVPFECENDWIDLEHTWPFN